MKRMSGMVKARLGEDTERLVIQLEKRLGWTRSRIVREAINLLAVCRLPKTRRIIGQGKRASGIHDLGFNKKHLRDFGRTRLP